MQIKQLQAIAYECRELLKAIHALSLPHDDQQERAIQRAIRQRRAEVTAIREEIKQLRMEEKKKVQLCKQIRTAEQQLSSMQAIAVKERAHHRHLEALSQKLQQNLLEQKIKTNKLLEQAGILEQFEGYVTEGIQLEVQYITLKAKYEEVANQSLLARGKWEEAVRGRKEWVAEMAKNNEAIEAKIHLMTTEITVQQQIISEISQLEAQPANLHELSPKKSDRDSFTILDPQAQALFRKSSDLDPWEKHEITNLLRKKEEEKEKQARRIGSIFRQRLRLNRSEDKHTQRQKHNFSADLKNVAKRTPQKIDSQRFRSIHFVSNDRIRELERNKRVRTRYTEPLQNSSQIRKEKIKIDVQEEQQKEPGKQSIISIYERFKEQRNEDSFSVVRFRRKENKRKSSQKNKGVPIERQMF